MSERTNEEVAVMIADGMDDFFSRNHVDQTVIVKTILDMNIGSDVNAKIKEIKIPGIPFSVSGAALEASSDAVLGAVAKIFIEKVFAKKDMPDVVE